MWKKYKKKLSSFLIVTLIASLFVPQLNVIADTADVIVGDNGTIYDADYEPYIYDEDDWEYDEDEDDESNVEILASGSNATPSNASPSNASLASASNIASASNWAEIFKTNVFTDAGPFMPAVPVSSAAQMMRAFSLRSSSGDGTNTSALQLAKSAEANGNGTYTITLEAYTTGKVVTTTTTTPVDIVLVLDQSGSMAYDFDGNSTSVNENRRQYAMKEAVNSFISEVGDRFVAENSDHRVAIVTFGSKASPLMGWTFVDEAGKEALQSKIAELPDSPSGATNIAAGMEAAEELMGSEYNYTTSDLEAKRQKVVIVFTDGVPTTSSDFSTTVANDAIASAKNLKDSGVTVYSIGIFNGAKEEELYGSENFDKNSNGSVGSNWSDFSFWMIGDVKSYDVPAGNRFLNYLSNNFKTSTKIGIKNYSKTWIGIGYYGWEITKNFDRDDTGYYLTADDAASLKKIFSTISQNISSSDATIDSTTVVKDIISEYFTLPANTSKVNLYVSDYQKDGSFKTRVDAPESVKATVKDDTVNVTGFDFYNNFVDLNGVGRSESDMNAGGEFYGRKLIIEFTVTPKVGFLGGNNVPTNGEDSGIYLNGEDESLDTFDVPYVDVPIPEITVTAEDKNIYLAGSLDAEQLLEGGSVETENNVTLDLDPSVENYGLAGWQRKFVNIQATVPTDMSQLTDDSTYELSVTISPKDSAVTDDPAVAQSGTDTADIYVYLPMVTFMDGEVYYGDNVPESNYLETLQYGNIVWKHGDSISTDKEIEMIEELPPEVTFTFIPTADTSLVSNGKVVSKSDIPILVTDVKVGNVSGLISYTSFARKLCESVTENELNGEGHFVLHVKTCELTIIKVGGATDETYIFRVIPTDAVNQKDMYITITGNGSKTIKELPVGTYRVVEDDDWAWRYKSSMDKESVTLSSKTPTGAITCTNVKDKDKWLNNFSAVWKNTFGISGGKR